jgi:PEP-CTERM motif
MKKTSLLILSLLSALVLSANAQSVTLSNFGSSAEGFPNAPAGWNYNQTTSVLSGANSIDSLLFSVSGSPWNISTVGTNATRQIQLTISGPPTGTGTFNFTLEDNGSRQFLSPTFDWTEFGSVNTVAKNFSAGTTPSGFNFSNITGWNMNSSSASGSINVTLSSLSVVPEPSTYALMALGGLALFFIARRRKAQA